MIYIKTDEEIELMREANQLVGKTLGELAQKSEDEIESMRNVGRMTLNEIHAKLAEYNLRLGMTDYSHLKNTIKVSRQKEETDEA